MKLILTYKFSSNAISGYLLAAKKVEARVSCVLVRDDTQQPDSLK